MRTLVFFHITVDFRATFGSIETRERRGVISDRKKNSDGSEILASHSIKMVFCLPN